MGSIWLHDLPFVLEDAGLPVRTWPGWETRSRSSGGYDALLAIGTHHTASRMEPDDECSYLWERAADRPIGAMLLDRTGRITIGAAGATNTQGKGGPMPTSGGTIPLDQGNRYMLSIEAANDGVGELWPAAQIESYVEACAALCVHYGLDPNLFPNDVNAHFEWTSRKIDPAGNSRYATGGNSWDMTSFRNDVVAIIDTPEPEPEPLPGDEMQKTSILAIYEPTAELLGNGLNKTFGRMLDSSVQWITGPDVEHARAEGVKTYSIRGEEHYRQLESWATNV